MPGPLGEKLKPANILGNNTCLSSVLKPRSTQLGELSPIILGLYPLLSDDEMRFRVEGGLHTEIHDNL